MRHSLANVIVIGHRIQILQDDTYISDVIASLYTWVEKYWIYEFMIADLCAGLCLAVSTLGDIFYELAVAYLWNV